MTDLDKRIEWLRCRVPIEDVYLEQVRFIMQHYADEYHQSKLKNNEVVDLVSQRYTIEDIERCVENWGLCKVEKEYIERFLNGG